jgi:hypothetical protein
MVIEKNINYWNNLRDYFESSLRDSILAYGVDELKKGDSWYRDSEACTFNDFFSSNIDNGCMYSTADGFCEENLVVLQEDMQQASELFETVRKNVVDGIIEEYEEE